MGGFVLSSRWRRRSRPIMPGGEMKLHSDRTTTGGQRITAYGAGFVTVNETTFTGTVLLGADVPATDLEERRPDDLDAATIEQLREQDPELVIIGTGSRHVFPSPGLLAPLTRAGIGVEIMSTPAACRTYNVLSAEGRKVVALLLPVVQRNC